MPTLKAAREDGSMLEPVTLNELATAATDVQRFEGRCTKCSPNPKRSYQAWYS
jgi:hypothetical protein